MYVCVYVYIARVFTQPVAWRTQNPVERIFFNSLNIKLFTFQTYFSILRMKIMFKYNIIM